MGPSAAETNQNSAVNLGGTGNHVLDVVGVAGHVDVGVVALFALVLLVGSSDGNTAGLFLGRVVDLVISDRLVDCAGQLLSQVQR